MLATFCPVFSDPVWRASAAKHVGDPLPPFPVLPVAVVVGVSVAETAASVEVAAAASVVAATSVTATLELPPFPPRPFPPLPPLTLPVSASVFVVAIEGTTSAADEIWAGGAEGAGGGEEGTAAAGVVDLFSHCRFFPPLCGSRYCQPKSR